MKNKDQKDGKVYHLRRFNSKNMEHLENQINIGDYSSTN